MKFADVTLDLVRKAVGIYLDLAYGGGGRARREPDLAVAQPDDPDSVMSLFHKERVEDVPGSACLRYSLRLGNRNYPFMKLLLQEHLLAGEFFFAVDTHDEMDIRPDFPDYESWMAVRRFNRDLKRRIESQLEAEGLDTAAAIRRLVAARGVATGLAGRGTVLVVDDEEDLAASVAALLQAQGFHTVQVHDGQSALRVCAEIGPDLVLLDYEMPDLDGIEVLAQLRADPVTQAVPVLLTSAGRVSMGDIRKAEGFLAKPCQAELLCEMVQRVLRCAREARQ